MDSRAARTPTPRCSWPSPTRGSTEGTYDQRLPRHACSIGLRELQALRAGRRGRRAEDPEVGRAHLRRALLHHQGPRPLLGRRTPCPSRTATADRLSAPASRTSPRASRWRCSACRALGKPGANQFKFMEWTLFGMPTRRSAAARRCDIPSLRRRLPRLRDRHEGQLHPQDHDSRGHHEPARAVVRAYRGRLPARGPVRRALHVPARGRAAASIWCGRTPRAGRPVGTAASRCRTPCATSPSSAWSCSIPWMENDTLFADIILPIQHEVRDGGHRHRLAIPASGTSCSTSAKPSSPSASRSPTRRSSPRLPRALEQYGGVYEGMLGQVPGRQDRRRVDQGRLRERRGVPEDLHVRGVQGEAVLCRSPRARTGRTSPPASASSTTTPRGTRCARHRASWSTTQPRSRHYFPDDRERGPIPHWIDEGAGHQERRVPGARAEVPLPARLEPPALPRARAA